MFAHDNWLVERGSLHVGNGRRWLSRSHRPQLCLANTDLWTRLLPLSLYFR